ncbi:MAG: hypothetical protein FH749_10975 [Firmicutes bacterium]|nr:hypothetical protein [Bacillota bacterium]
MFRRASKIILVSVLGAASTWYLNTQVGLGPVAASGIVGLLAAVLLTPELAVATYTASFAGMSSLAVLGSLPMVLMTGLLVGGIFIIALPVYQGFGGKLGTIAACAVLLTVFVFGLL